MSDFHTGLLIFATIFIANYLGHIVVELKDISNRLMDLAHKVSQK